MTDSESSTPTPTTTTVTATTKAITATTTKRNSSSSITYCLVIPYGRSFNRILELSNVLALAFSNYKNNNNKTTTSPVQKQKVIVLLDQRYSDWYLDEFGTDANNDDNDDENNSSSSLLVTIQTSNYASSRASFPPGICNGGPILTGQDSFERRDMLEPHYTELAQLLPRRDIQDEAQRAIEQYRHGQQQQQQQQRLVVTVHRRDLEGGCELRSNRRMTHCPIEMLPKMMNSTRLIDEYCKISYDKVQTMLARNYGLLPLSMVDDEEGSSSSYTVVLATDGQVPELDRTFPIISNHSFMVQAWMMVLSDIHIGNPMSTVDYVVAHWRSLPDIQRQREERIMSSTMQMVNSSSSSPSSSSSSLLQVPLLHQWPPECYGAHSFFRPTTTTTVVSESIRPSASATATSPDDATTAVADDDDFDTVDAIKMMRKVLLSPNFTTSDHSSDKTIMPDHWPMVRVEDLMIREETTTMTTARTNPFVTLVTAFFPVVGSKHKRKEYDTWMRNLLSLKDAMVIFTTGDDNIQYMTKLRRAHAASNRTLIVNMTLNDTMMIQQYGWETWQQQWTIDPEKHLHCKELYVIWNEKVNLLARVALDMNPFGSQYFSWIDAGYFRGDNDGGRFANQVHTQVLPADLVRDYQEQRERQRMMLLDVSRLSRSKLLYNVGAGYMGGFAPAIRQWNATFYEYIQTHISTSFVGKEQNTMNHICRLNASTSSLCLLIKAKKGQTIKKFEIGDPWFFMSPFLGGHVSDNEILTASSDGG